MCGRPSRTADLLGCMQQQEAIAVMHGYSWDSFISVVPFTLQILHNLRHLQEVIKLEYQKE